MYIFWPLALSLFQKAPQVEFMIKITSKCRKRSKATNVYRLMGSSGTGHTDIEADRRRGRVVTQVDKKNRWTLE